MPGSTSRGGFRYPLGGDPPDTDGDIKKLADDVAANAALYSQSVAGSRPAPGVVGRYHYATDTGAFTYDQGSAWVSVTPGGADPFPQYLTGTEADAAYLRAASAGLKVHAASVNSVISNGVASVTFPDAFATPPVVTFTRRVTAQSGYYVTQLKATTTTGFTVESTNPGAIADPNNISYYQPNGHPVNLTYIAIGL